MVNWGIPNYPNSMPNSQKKLHREPLTMKIRLDQFNNSDFDRGAGRLKEVIWMVTKAFLLQLHFPLPSGARALGLRLFGARIGKGVIIRPGVNVTYPWRLTVGDHCWIGEDVTILSLAPVSIGDHCCISQRAFLCTGSHNFSKETFDLIARPISIGSHSWIAACAFVGPGASIAEGTMIKAGDVFLEKRDKEK